MATTTSSLIDELFKCVEAIGCEETYILLQKGQHPDTEFSDPKIKFVVESVAKKMQLSVNEIMYGYGRKNERKMAIGFCAYYLGNKDYIGLDMNYVSEQLNKSYVLCYKYAREVKELNESHLRDKRFFDIKKELDKIILKHIKK